MKNHLDLIKVESKRTKVSKDNIENDISKFFDTTKTMTNDVIQKLEEKYAKIIKIGKIYECFDSFVKLRTE